MASKTRVLSVIACGAGPAAAIGTLVKQALDRGWTVQVIATPSALEFFDAREIEAQTGSPVRSQYSKPGAPRSRIPDAIIVAPATFNTINQWALGISGTYAPSPAVRRSSAACRRCARRASASCSAPAASRRTRRTARRMSWAPFPGTWRLTRQRK
jgi:hypothetical protein